MFLRTIRFRLTLWYALSLAIVLLASGLFWYYYLSRSLLGHVDDRLLNVAQDVVGFLEEEPAAGNVQVDCQALETFVRRNSWAGFVQIQNENGTRLCPSGNLAGVPLPLTNPALLYLRQGQNSYETVHTEEPALELRLLTYSSRRPAIGPQLIQVAENLDPVRHSLEDLRLLLLTFSPLALLALSFGGWFLASRALAPVSRITRAAQNINARNLSEQLPVNQNGDEITRLAETFNAMLARLEEAFRKTRQFSADASHELRTPLTILKGETEVALRWAKTPEEFHDILNSNLEEIDRMGRMIEDLLTLAKSDAGEFPPDLHRFSLSDTLQHLYLQTRALGEAKGVEIVLNPEVTKEIHLVGDELRLRQVFLNLIVNAVKYTPEGGRIEVILNVEGEEAVVSVKDTGIGIAAEHLPSIFDRFYRIDEARNRKDGGSGLGLAIAQAVVEAHQGKIQVTSAPGIGSTFQVRLPLDGGRKAAADQA